MNIITISSWLIRHNEQANRTIKRFHIQTVPYSQGVGDHIIYCFERDKVTITSPSPKIDFSSFCEQFLTSPSFVKLHELTS